MLALPLVAYVVVMLATADQGTDWDRIAGSGIWLVLSVPVLIGAFVVALSRKRPPPDPTPPAPRGPRVLIEMMSDDELILVHAAVARGESPRLLSEQDRTLLLARLKAEAEKRNLALQ